MRWLFSESRYFQLFDAYDSYGNVLESVYAYTNGDDNQMAMVLYNNQYERVEGWINLSVPKLIKENGERRNEVVSLAQSLRLRRGVRRFMIYRNFNNGKTYLYPSAKLFEEGMKVVFNGYETKVFTNIYEVEDIDGVYERLYEKYHGHGIVDIENEIRVLYLQPFFETVEPIKGQKFFKDLKAILQGKGTSMNRRNIMQALGSCYTYMEEFDPLFDKIGLNMHLMKPQTILDLLNRLQSICRREVFANANTIMDNDLLSVFAAGFLTMPFISANSSLEDAAKVVQILQLDRFFGIPMATASMCAIIATKRDESVRELLENRVFLDLIGRNEYQGVRWFRGEAFQECMYLLFLSKAIHAEEDLSDEQEMQIRKEISMWLKKGSSAQYRLDNLLTE